MSYPAFNHEKNETGRKCEKEKKKQNKKEQGLRRGVSGIQIMPSSGRVEHYSHSEKREAKKYDKPVFHDAIQKAAGQREAVKSNI